MAFDPTAASLGEEIKRAREALIRTSEESPGHWWTPRDLKAKAKSDWSYGAGNLALGRLIEDGIFNVEQDKVRLDRDKVRGSD